ncbi:hypothetical protein ABIF65_002576 [Bradyrhizobium japonicum]
MNVEASHVVDDFGLHRLRRDHTGDDLDLRIGKGIHDAARRLDARSRPLAGLGRRFRREHAVFVRPFGDGQLRRRTEALRDDLTDLRAKPSFIRAILMKFIDDGDGGGH